MQESPTTIPDRRDATCPTCGAPAERGQLVCLECGGRIVLAYRRPPSWKIPVAITVIVLVLAGAGGVAAYQAIDDDAEQEVAATPPNDPRGAGAEGSGDDRADGDSDPARGEKDESEDVVLGEEPAEEGGSSRGERDRASGEGGDDDAAAADGLIKRGPLYTWPPRLEAFTVVLLSAEDRASATSFARSAAAEGGTRIGVLRASDFQTLPSGFFVVFAGEYETRPAADRAASRLGQRFRGAFPQLVRR